MRLTDIELIEAAKNYRHKSDADAHLVCLLADALTRMRDRFSTPDDPNADVDQLHLDLYDDACHAEYRYNTALSLMVRIIGGWKPPRTHSSQAIEQRVLSDLTAILEFEEQATEVKGQASN